MFLLVLGQQEKPCYLSQPAAGLWLLNAFFLQWLFFFSLCHKGRILPIHEKQLSYQKSPTRKVGFAAPPQLPYAPWLLLWLKLSLSSLSVYVYSYVLVGMFKHSASLCQKYSPYIFTPMLLLLNVFLLLYFCPFYLQIIATKMIVFVSVKM